MHAQQRRLYRQVYGVNRHHWWRDAVIYQVYVRSFLDSTGDGVGDLAGVRAGLPYLHKLGVDGIWLSPFYPSPQHDHGYDVADYRGVDPLFGDLDEFDALVAAARRLGIRVLLDIVPNHCSSEHPWFREALAAEPGSPARARFHFADGRGPDGDEPPNNWHAMFGGPAWTRVTEADGRPGQWYLHMFTPEQPDWNWRTPEVAAEFDRIPPLLARPGASTASASTWPPASTSTWTCPTPRTRRPTPAPATRSTARLEPARGARRVAAVARGVRGVRQPRRPRAPPGR